MHDMTIVALTWTILLNNSFIEFPSLENAYMPRRGKIVNDRFFEEIFFWKIFKNQLF
jgi:hypothetical protein